MMCSITLRASHLLREYSIPVLLYTHARNYLLFISKGLALIVYFVHNTLKPNSEATLTPV